MAPETSSASSENGTWAGVDWSDVAAQAEAAGDESAAADARAAQRLATGTSTFSPVTAILKKAAIALLRFSADKLPKAMRPYAHAIADVLDEINSFQETVVVGALLHVGIPYDIAVEAARWFVIFVGV